MKFFLSMPQHHCHTRPISCNLYTYRVQLLVFLETLSSIECNEDDDDDDEEEEEDDDDDNDDDDYDDDDGDDDDDDDDDDDVDNDDDDVDDDDDDDDDDNDDDDDDDNDDDVEQTITYFKLKNTYVSFVCSSYGYLVPYTGYHFYIENLRILVLA